MTHPQLSPRAQALLDRIDAWAARGPVRKVLVRAGVTIGGPVVVVAGIAMLVLPGPGLVVIALGMALLALEYDWARSVLAVAGHGAAWVRRAVLPRDGSPGRRLVGVAGAGAFLVASTLATGAVTTYVGAQTFL
ncbi:PGPGW domain-containing protein [Nocardioides sp. URHA0032]|uniref:PGPGW domain-containing protein n=1 Tax=Nocardioides sp. URHA0032 TaxID=1380388 RepID=UPI0006885444|nr:PGPGW domain-containing protein [Nocardioides sp. URHA0032]